MQLLIIYVGDRVPSLPVRNRAVIKIVMFFEIGVFLRRTSIQIQIEVIHAISVFGMKLVAISVVGVLVVQVAH